MNEQELAGTLSRCFPGNWNATSNGDEMIVFDLQISPTVLNFGFSARLKPGNEPIIALGDRLIRADHPLIGDVKGLPIAWSSFYDVVKKVQGGEYYPCEGISDQAAKETWSSDRRPPSLSASIFEQTRSSGGMLETSTVLYANNCEILIRRPKRAAASPSCAYCRLIQKQLVDTWKKWQLESSTNRYAKYSRAGLVAALAEKADKIQAISARLHQVERQLEKLSQLGRRQAAERCLDILNEDHLSDSPTLPSTAAMFLQQQFKAHLLSECRTMRWDPQFIEWAIRVHVKSATAYDFLIDSNAVLLPSVRTIFRHLSKLPACIGFNDVIIRGMVNEYLSTYQQPYAKYLAMSIDEMKIRANLVFDQKSNELVGYVDSTDTINALGQSGSDHAQRIATDVLVVYVRGVATGFQCAVAWFPVRSLSAGEIMSIVWTAKRKVEFFSFNDGYPRLKVVTCTCDGLAANHLFFKLHGGGDASQLQYKAVDPLDPDNFLYFIVDICHLVKTVRNNIEKSSTDENATKCLVYDDKPILWEHFEQLYLDDVKNTWRLVPKITHRHIYLTGSDRMKVKLATQLLSQTVRLALTREGTGSTSLLCWIMNRIFDILNGRHPDEARRKRNDDVAPLSSPNDPRLEWLLSEGIGFFTDWENDVNASPLSRSEKQRRLLSVQTRAGLFVTIHGFVEAVRWFLSQPDAPPYILSSVFNQDRLEAYFGHVRAAGCSNEHPDWNRFQRIASTLNFVKLADLKAVRGSNISEANHDIDRRRSL